MVLITAVAGAILAALAFPPVGLWPLVVAGPAVWLWGLRRTFTPRMGALSGWLFGLVFNGGLIWWISELGVEAVVALVLLQSLYPTLFGWIMVRFASQIRPEAWWIAAAAGWAIVEAIRYRFPVGGFEWGAWGYALSDLEWIRNSARWIGTSGWTMLIAATAAALATLRRRDDWPVLLVPTGLALAALVAGAAAPALPDGLAVEAVVVQGSTPCPFEHCPDERYLTYVQHLVLTGTVPAGRADLVVWSEGSTGSTNADPVMNRDVGEAIGAEAARLGAWMVVGGDRPVSDEEWINANVVFAPSGEIVGEYRKQHPVPFGEYIPARPLFGWIPALDQVPRDMIPGQGPVVFDLGHYQLGTIVSFEGSFARYAREMATEGADLLVIATNEGSYGLTPASDQFIAMTRMRSAETGLDVIHSAVTGKSVFITNGGELGETTGLGAVELLYGSPQARPGLTTLYVRLGDWMMWVAVVAAAATLLLTPSYPPSYIRD